MSVEIVTIGVYGFTKESFFQALKAAKVDTFCDIRQRRGVRGSTYAFANSQRLQARLAEMGIRYLHRKDLAPTALLRQRQYEADKSSKTSKRQRSALDPSFVQLFQQDILAAFDSRSLLDDLPDDAQIVVLCCVEREPGACHRSLVAEKLQKELGLGVNHIMP